MEPSSDEIRALLNAQWDNLALPSANDGSDCLIPDVDSLTAVEALLALDEVLGTTIPMELIKPGGYESKEEFVTELGDKIIDHIKGQL